MFFLDEEEGGEFSPPKNIGDLKHLKVHLDFDTLDSFADLLVKTNTSLMNLSLYMSRDYRESVSSFESCWISLFSLQTQCRISSWKPITKSLRLKNSAVVWQRSFTLNCFSAIIRSTVQRSVNICKVLYQTIVFSSSQNRSKSCVNVVTCWRRQTIK